MVGEYFRPWIGPHYGKMSPKILVVGESRHDEAYTDHDIIANLISGNKISHKTFTNFLQAATGRHNTDPQYDPVSFLNSIIFYNYNTHFFPGGPRVVMEEANPDNARIFRDMLRQYSPSHVIPWGYANFDMIVGNFQNSQVIPVEGGENKVYASLRFEGQNIYLLRMLHPSTAFSASEWAPVIGSFLDILN